MVEAPRRVKNLVSTEETMVADATSKKDSSEKESSEESSDSGWEGEGVKTASAFKADPWADWEDDTAIYNSKVAATVNGAPILNGDVLDRYAGLLISAREQMKMLHAHPEKLQRGQPRPTPEDYEKFRDTLVQRDLGGHIQRRLLVERMKSSLKAEQIKSMDAHIDALFEKEVDKLKKELKVSTKTELELELNKKGTTLQNVKDNFATERMAMEYIVMKSEKPDPIDRMDLVAYYKEHRDDYNVAAQVKWEQIQVSFGPERSKAKAEARLQEALDELANGTPFEDVAKKYSDGPTAKAGGQWDWMESGNLTDTELEAKLFELPVGKLSPIHEGKSALHVVRIQDRKKAGRIPFGDVQEEIRQKLEEAQNKERPKKLFEDLMREAVIETRFDQKTAASPF